MKILLTGVAGFIGARVAEMLLQRGDRVVGIDNLNDYYDVSLKRARLKRLLGTPQFRFNCIDIRDADAFHGEFSSFQPDRVVHLAAQAGVRHSLKDPRSYVDVNMAGFLNVLEACRHLGTEHLVFASSSSVYGANTHTPFSEHHNVDHPVSLYGASKKANELMAHAYSHLYGIPATGLRFFTVYGPWGRPDMALFIFTRQILAGEAIHLFNDGHHQRDFTYIDDIADGVVRVLDRPARPDPDWNADRPDPAGSAAPYRVYNIGNNNPVPLLEFVDLLESRLGRKADRVYLPMQPGDVAITFADVADLARDTGYAPSTPVAEGIDRFVSWYQSYYGVPG